MSTIREHFSGHRPARALAMGICGLLFVTFSLVTAATENFQTKRRESILTVEIESLRIGNGDMEDAL